MTAILRDTPRAAAPADVIALQYTTPTRMIGIPLAILAGVVVVNVVIAIAVLRAGGDVTGSYSNGSVLWSVLGYTVAVGVQNVSASFPFALALGSTRQTFVVGNLLASAIQALLLAATAIALLGLERVTGGWFLGLHVLSSDLLGRGNALVLGGTIFLTILTALCVGGAFGASWVRFGARGPLLVSVGLVAVGAIVLLLGLPEVVALADAAQPWWAAAGCVAVIAAALPGQYLFLRSASIR